MPQRRSANSTLWHDEFSSFSDDPPRPIHGAMARRDPLDHHQQEAAGAQAQVERERRNFENLPALVCAELQAEAKR